MHMRDHHHVDLIRGVARAGQHAGDPGAVQPGVKQHQFAAGIDHGRGEIELRAVGGDEVGLGHRLESRLIDVHSKDPLGVIGHRAAARQKRGHLKAAQREAVEALAARAQHRGSGAGRACARKESGGKRQGCARGQGMAARKGCRGQLGGSRCWINRR